MKTKAFTFILLATMIIGYSSCSSDDTLDKDEIELTWEEKLVISEKVAESLNGNTFRCEELNSEFEVISAGKPSEGALYVMASFRFTGDVKLGNLSTADGSSTIANCTIEGYNITISSGGVMVSQRLIFKYINEDVIEGIDSKTKGTWRRVK